jgi:hypothetical protein
MHWCAVKLAISYFNETSHNFPSSNRFLAFGNQNVCDTCGILPVKLHSTLFSRKYESLLVQTSPWMKNIDLRRFWSVVKMLRRSHAGRMSSSTFPIDRVFDNWNMKKCNACGRKDDAFSLLAQSLSCPSFSLSSSSSTEKVWAVLSREVLHTTFEIQFGSFNVSCTWPVL